MLIGQFKQCEPMILNPEHNDKPSPSFTEITFDSFNFVKKNTPETRRVRVGYSFGGTLCTILCVG